MSRERAPADESVLNPVTPSEELAQSIVAALVEDSLISQVDGETIRAALATGKLTAATWRLVLENQLDGDRRGK